MTPIEEQLPAALRIGRAGTGSIPRLEKLDEMVFGRDHYSMLAWRQILDISGPLAVVASVDPDRDVVGFAVVTPGWRRDTGWLIGIAVTPSLRNRGIGEKLLRYVIRESVCCHISTIRLTVDPRNPAVRLYGRNGFVSEGGELDYFGEGRERIVMRLSL